MHPQQTRQARSYTYPQNEQYGVTQQQPLGSAEQPSPPMQTMPTTQQPMGMGTQQPMGAQLPIPAAQQSMGQQPMGMGGQPPMGAEQPPMGATQQPPGAAQQPTDWEQVGTTTGALFGGLGWENPADKAQHYLSKISSILAPYFDPYIKAGRVALPFYEKQSMEAMRDPSKLMSQMGEGFQQSPGYQYSTEEATKAANQAAAAGGMAGSPAEQQQLAQSITGMSNQDYYNYLNHVIDLYSKGMGGVSDINKLGYQASTRMGTDLADVAMSQAKTAYLSQALSNMHQASSGADIGKAIGKIAMVAMLA